MERRHQAIVDEVRRGQDHVETLRTKKRQRHDVNNLRDMHILVVLRRCRALET